MNCPHCQGKLPAHKPVSNKKRCKVFGHHGEMDLDHGQLHDMAAFARQYLTHARKIQDARKVLELYSEVAQRMEYDPAFARHVLSYDGHGGWRWFPGATKAALSAEIKGRFARGQARPDDLERYIGLHMTYRGRGRMARGWGARHGRIRPSPPRSHFPLLPRPASCMREQTIPHRGGCHGRSESRLEVFQVQRRERCRLHPLPHVRRAQPGRSE